LPDIARILDRARLPDIDPESGAAYRSIWLVARYALPKSLIDWAGELVSLQKQFESTLTKIQRRKASKGCVLWRSFTAYYTLNEAWVHWKVMFKEGAPHGADDAVAELCRVMDSKVYDDRRYVHGELATLQLIENARTHLLGFSPDIDWEEKFELFAAHLDATKGRHVFQSMGLLWDLMRETLKNGHAAPEPMTCDVPGCGKRLKIAVHRDRSPSDEGAPPTTRGPDPPRRHQASGGAI
jgi:hypothetical protein